MMTLLLCNFFLFDALPTQLYYKTSHGNPVTLFDALHPKPCYKNSHGNPVTWFDALPTQPHYKNSHWEPSILVCVFLSHLATFTAFLRSSVLRKTNYDV